MLQIRPQASETITCTINAHVFVSLTYSRREAAAGKPRLCFIQVTEPE
jgi:hypothetical protein